MVGWITFRQARGWRVALAQRTVCTLPLLAAEIPLRPGLGEKAVRRRTERAAALLAQAGCRRALAPPGFAHWDVLEDWGLRGVDPAPLCQALAAPLALAALARMGLEPGRATVELRGARVGRSFFQAAQALCPAVRRLVITAPTGGEELAAYLRSEYGVPVLERGAGAAPDVIVRFSPEPGGAGNTLSLCPPAPFLAGLGLRARGRALPEGAQTLPLLALLWEEGRLGLDEIESFPMPRAGN